MAGVVSMRDRRWPFKSGTGPGIAETPRLFLAAAAAAAYAGHPMAHIRIGDMLVAAGFVTQDQVDQALASQKLNGRRLGEELIALGFVTETQMTQVLSNQLAIPWVSLNHVEFSRELLDRIPGSLARDHGVIPIYERVVRREGETLFVAMADPTNREALSEVAAVVGMPVKPMVAPPTDIRNAIEVYYFGVPPASLVPPPPAEDEAEIEIEELDEAQQRAVEQVAQKVESQPNKPAPARFLTLTLLDGTTVRLPAPAGAAGTSAAAARKPVGSELIAALAKREPLVAAALKVLLDKHLISDGELLAAYETYREG